MNLERYKTTKRDVAMSTVYLLGMACLGGTVYQSYETHQSYGKIKSEFSRFNSENKGELVELTDEQRETYINLVFQVKHKLVNSRSIRLSENQVVLLPSLDASYENYQDNANIALLFGLPTVLIGACGVVGAIENGKEQKTRQSS